MKKIRKKWKKLWFFLDFFSIFNQKQKFKKNWLNSSFWIFFSKITKIIIFFRTLILKNLNLTMTRNAWFWTVLLRENVEIRIILTWTFPNEGQEVERIWGENWREIAIFEISKSLWNVVRPYPAVISKFGFSNYASLKQKFFLEIFWKLK